MSDRSTRESLSHDAKAEALAPLVYEELRQLAVARLRGESALESIQPTALVHEAYLRLVRSGTPWDSRGHFFAAAARAMRQILVDRARSRRRVKRGGQRQRVDIDLDQVDQAGDASAEDLLALNDALTRLEQIDPRKCEIVMLRYFAGLTIAGVAEALGLSATTVKDEWAFARAWLHSELVPR